MRIRSLAVGQSACLRRKLPGLAGAKQRQEFCKRYPAGIVRLALERRLLVRGVEADQHIQRIAHHGEFEEIGQRLLTENEIKALLDLGEADVLAEARLGDGDLSKGTAKPPRSNSRRS